MKKVFFDKATLQRVVKVNDNALYANIKRWLKKGELVQLKKGLYVTKTYLQKVADQQDYAEWLANILKQPSYLSGEYVLQKYSMLTESVFVITSVSFKKTSSYQNNLGAYTHSRIKEELFTGFQIINKGTYQIKQASKAKALFDFLYFRLWRLPEVNKDYLASFCLNLGEMQEVDFAEFETYIKLTKIKKFRNLTATMKELI